MDTVVNNHLMGVCVAKYEDPCLLGELFAYRFLWSQPVGAASAEVLTETPGY